MTTIINTFENLKEYNKNKFVKENHVFIEGEGTFYKNIEIAKNEFNSKNCVGIYLETKNFKGLNVYRYLNRNVWN